MKMELRMDMAMRQREPEIGEDAAIRGAAEIYERAHAWGHLPMAMDFTTFLAAIRRGDDPFVESAHEFRYLDAIR